MTSSLTPNSAIKYVFNSSRVTIRSENTITLGDLILPVQPRFSSSCLNFPSFVNLEFVIAGINPATAFRESISALSSILSALAAFNSRSRFFTRCSMVSIKACGLDRKDFSSVILKRDDPLFFAMSERSFSASRTFSSGSEASIR